MQGHIVQAQEQKEFLFAGNATFTILNTQTGNRFTFKVTKADERPGQQPLYFVGVLTGPDNNAHYTYLGVIRNFTKFEATRASRNLANSPSFKAFSWLFSNIGNFPGHVEFWHEGTCARCGRKLTVPESIESGYGPECIKHTSRHANFQWAAMKNEFARREAAQEARAHLS